MITSKSNKKIKDISLLIKKSGFRKETGLFVVEGIRMFRELPEGSIAEIIISDSFYKQAGSELKVFLDRHSCEIVSDEIYNFISDTKTPQGVLATVHAPTYDIDKVISSNKNPLVIILEHLQDPGNLGTIIRSSEGAGISLILADENTADVYNPKVVRSTMGSIFRVPYIISKDLKTAIAGLKEKGIAIYATHLDKDSLIYDLADLTKPSAFMIGNEAAGLTDDLAKLADKKLHIPMLGNVESLNASVAASVVMYEAARQRRKA